jgi:serpin B
MIRPTAFQRASALITSILVLGLGGCILGACGGGSESGPRVDAAAGTTSTGGTAGNAGGNGGAGAGGRTSTTGPAGSGGSSQDAAATSRPENDARVGDAGAADGLPDSADSGASVSLEAGSDLPDLARTQVEPTDLEKAALASQLSEFALGLLPQLGKTAAAAGNYAFSPVSLSLALSMAYAGARGTTAAQMKDVLHIATLDEAYYRSLSWLDGQLQSRVASAITLAQKEKSGAVVDSADYRLGLVNAVWGDKTLSFERAYLDTLATGFGAGVRVADFRGQAEKERIAINSWVSQETLHRIEDLIPPGFVDADTRCVLVNALYLKLPWADPFLASDTASGSFTKADGTKVSVPFMSFKSGGGHLSFPYAENDSTQAVEIPLDGKEISFVVLLPKSASSLAQLESALSATTLKALMAQMTEQPVALKLPKFRLTTPSIDFAPTLVALGMKDAFDGGKADFSGMTQEPLAISHVLHKTMMGVDEHGVEAAAATAVPLTWSSAPEPKSINVDRPFFFGIYDRPTGTWLFLGHVVDPSS